MIYYSAKSKDAYSFLYRPYNDIDIYIEDTLSRRMYEILINKILNGKAKVNRIFQIGGKPAVISKCREIQSDKSRRRLYLIDGDLDLLAGLKPPKLKYLYQLKVYCIENIIISVNSILEAATDIDTNSKLSIIKNKLKIELFLNETISRLIPLFKIYAISHYLGSRETTVSYKVHRLCIERKLKSRRTSKYISSNKVNNRIDNIRTVLKANFSNSEIKRATNKVSREVAKINMNGIISGKDYLLPLIYHKLQQKIKIKEDIEQLKVKMATYCDSNANIGLKRALLKTAKT